MNQRLSLIASILICVGGVLSSCRQGAEPIGKAVVISANAEWKVVKEVFPNEEIQNSPWGEFFFKEIPVGSAKERILFFHGGWGKVAAAGSTQYCIDTWHPKYVINLGTCGGFEGLSKRYEVILADKTIIYDIVEAMGDSKEAIDDYSTQLDLSWLKGDLSAVTRTVLVSADKDLVPSEIAMLADRYHAVAGDWESGAIAYTCKRNNTRILILRGITDLVGSKQGEAYGKPEVFIQGTRVVMTQLLTDLPVWLEKCE